MDNNEALSAVRRLIYYMEHDNYLKELSYRELKDILVSTGRLLSRYMGAVTLKDIDLLENKTPDELPAPLGLHDKRPGRLLNVEK